MVKTQFGIKDLENLSNVKAHTIRIWEKRYNLLEPDRTDTNIRKYNIESLKKLLNIAYLYNAGNKISTLAELNPNQIKSLIEENLSEFNAVYLRDVFKLSMFEFDGERFDSTLKKLAKTKAFREIFSEVFIPLLNELGVLWHSGTIDPAHEHFISEKIKHSIIEHCNELKIDTAKDSSRAFVLYLPYEEIHEIGLLYANYELLSAGFKTIYLGANVPLESLSHVLNEKQKTTFVTYFTVKPENDNFEDYLDTFQKLVCSKIPCDLYILGRKVTQKPNNKNISYFNDLKQFIAHIEML